MPGKVNLIFGSPILKGLNSKRHNSKSFNSAKSALNHHSVKALKKFTGFFLPFFVAIPIQASSPIIERALASSLNIPGKTQIASKESSISEKILGIL